MHHPIIVFIIEDDESMMQLLGDFIHSKFPDFIIKKYLTGEKAVADMHLHPQVVILDHYLKGNNAEAMEGLDVLSKIRARNKSCRVVFFSAQENPDVSARAMKMGAYDYIVKDEKAFERVEEILSHFKKHLAIDNKAIAKKLYVVLLIVILLILLFYTIGKMVNS